MTGSSERLCEIPVRQRDDPQPTPAKAAGKAHGSKSASASTARAGTTRSVYSAVSGVLLCPARLPTADVVRGMRLPPVLVLIQRQTVVFLTASSAPYPEETHGRSPFPAPNARATSHIGP